MVASMSMRLLGNGCIYVNDASWQRLFVGMNVSWLGRFHGLNAFLSRVHKSTVATVPAGRTVPIRFGPSADQMFILTNRKPTVWTNRTLVN